MLLVTATLMAACSGLANTPTAPDSPEASAPTPAVASPSAGPTAAPPPIRIGVALPLSGALAGLAGQESLGIRIAADLVNADGGVGGRPIDLDVRDLESADGAPAVMAAFKAEGASVVIGAYSSDLSIPASSAAAADGLVYWEGGAEADQLTGRGLPLVFRVGASGANLGTNSADFAATALAPRLGEAASAVRVAIVAAKDPYASSVADAAQQTATAAGMPIVARQDYDVGLPVWPVIMADLKAARPDIIILASHIPDGIAFRQAQLAAGLTVKALIGSTMAECDPDFAGDLGADAIGIFASDRPTGGFQPDALDPAARATYDRLAAEWARLGPAAVTSPSSSAEPWPSTDAEYPLTGPDLTAVPATTPTEEGLSGFTAGWALFHDVLPVAGSLDPSGIAAAARTLDLPTGSLPNGAGLRFSSSADTLGQNQLAAAVIWQWQAVRTYTFVWPSTYATGNIAFVPLPR